MRSTRVHLILFALVSIGAACWLLQPFTSPSIPPSHSEAPIQTIPAPSPGSTNSGGFPTAGGVAPSLPPVPPELDEPHIEIALGNPDASSSARREPGPKMGGLPLDGEELVATGLPEIEALAATLLKAGANGAALKAHLRVAYGHVQRLRQYHEFADHAEAQVRALTEQTATGDPASPDGEASRQANLTAWQRTWQGELDRVAEYEDYTRRSLAQDFAITNQADVERILELGRWRPAPEIGPEPSTQFEIVPR